MTVRRALLAAALLTVLAGGAASADDHVRTALDRGQPGLGQSDPFCVPGGGSPNSGERTGTPSASDASCRADGTEGRGKP